MSPFGHVACAAMTATLAACAPQQTPERVSVDISATMAVMPIMTTTPLVSDFDIMRAALPAFDLERGASHTAFQHEISVVRDLVFTPDSSILSRAMVTRLAPLQVYLQANPSMAVRIEGYGDGVSTSARAADLSMARAQAVARALLADMKVTNVIVAKGAAVPQARNRAGGAEIMFFEPLANHIE